jgi:hypothetical protein
MSAGYTAFISTNSLQKLICFQAPVPPEKPLAATAPAGYRACHVKFLMIECIKDRQVLSLRKNDLQWLPPDAAKMHSMQQLNVTGSNSLSP